MAEQKPIEDKDFKHIIRIANTDLDGNKPILHAVRKIKGISFMFSNAVCKISKVDPTKKAGNLKDDEIKKLNEIIDNPLKFKIPDWMLNRRKDMEDGTTKHVLTGDLKFHNDADIKLLMKMKCYRGTRHSTGLPVRGQRTKANFRKNKGKVSLGVKKKSGAKSGRM